VTLQKNGKGWHAWLAAGLFSILSVCSIIPEWEVVVSNLRTSYTALLN